MKQIVAILIIFLLSVEARSQGVDYFLKSAFKNSPVLKIHEHRQSASHEEYKKESMLKENPELSVSYSNIPHSDWPSLNSHPMSGISIGIAQYIATPWEDTSRKNVLYQKYLSKKQALEEARNLLAFRVQEKYHIILFLYKKDEILKENMDVLDNIIKISGTLVAVNRMNSSHLLKLKADRATLSNDITEIEGRIIFEKSNLRRLCGSPVECNISSDIIKHWIKIEDSEMIGEGEFDIQKHPLYKEILSLYEARKAQYNLEIAELSPGAMLGFEYRVRQRIPGMDKGEDFLSFKASIPLPLYYPFKEYHAIKEQKERIGEMEEMLKDIELDLKSKWNGTLKNHRKLLVALKVHNSEILPGYWAAYQAHIGSLSSGTVSLLDVLDDYRMYLKASLENARIFRDIMISKLKLNYLLYRYPGKREFKGEVE